MAFASFDRRNTAAPMADINMVPLIDIMLVLLVIFIVTAPLLTHAVKLELPRPGMPGQPMYYVVPAKAANAQLARKFVDFAASPEIQAEGIVKQFNWYPGIDAQHVQSKLDKASWDKLFTDIKPDALQQYGRPFPLSEYFTDIVEGYERVVLK